MRTPSPGVAQRRARERKSVSVGKEEEEEEKGATHVLIFDPHVTGRLDIKVFREGRGPSFKLAALA